MKIALTLSAISLACVLSACGGGDDDSTSLNPEGGNDSTSSNNPGGGNSSTGQGSGSGTSSYTVTPNVSGGSGSISPTTPVSVVSGNKATIRMVPATGYTVSAADVSSTCGGSFSANSNGGSFTTGPVTANCRVAIKFRQNPPEAINSPVVKCFTETNETINYNVRVISSLRFGVSEIHKVITAPMNFNGERVMGQRFTDPSNSFATDYWKITSKGVEFIGYARYSNNSNAGEQYSFDNNVIPVDMKAGQVIEPTVTQTNLRTGSKTEYRIRTTFVGIEPTLIMDTPSGKKTFVDVCHLKMETMGDLNPWRQEIWVAPGGIWVKGLKELETNGIPQTLGTIYYGN
jgi:hypothetical protein